VDRFAITRKLGELQRDLASRATNGDGRARELLELPVGHGVKAERKCLVVLGEYYRDLGIADRYGLDLNDLIQGD
jgi:hypothetical protein